VLDILNDGWEALKQKEVFALGTIDCIFQGSIQLYIFFWTPILTYTANSKLINPGMIMLISMGSLLSQNKLLELFNRTFHPNYFKLAIVFLIYHMTNFALIYFIESFPIRLVILGLINVNIN
jgi:hypothetical protein